MRSKCDLVMFCCAQDQVCSSRCPAYAVENSLWLAESFILVCGIHDCQVHVWPSWTGFYLYFWGYLWSLNRSVCGFKPSSFPLISLFYPVGCISSRDHQPINMKLLGVLALEKHVTLHGLFLLKCGLSTCLSFSARCQRMKAGVPFTKNREELSI